MLKTQFKTLVIFTFVRFSWVLLIHNKYNFYNLKKMPS